MAKNKVAEANNTFSATIQKALSTVSQSRWNAFDHPKKGPSVRYYFIDDVAMKNASGAVCYSLGAHIITEVVDTDDGKGKRVKTREYIYQLSGTDSKPLYEFHWHPERIDPMTLEPKKAAANEKAPFPYPHIHVRATHSRFDNLNKKHIPSGRVAFEDVLHFLLDDCGMKSRRADWENVLKGTKAQFLKRKSW